MLAAIGLSLRLHYFASKLLPVLFSSMVLVLAVIALAKEVRNGREGKLSQTGRETGIRAKNFSEGWNYLRVAGWVAGFTLAIYLGGFLCAIPLFVGAYMKGHGSGWPGAVITALLFTGIVYVVFNIALQADLYQGKVPLWLGW